MPANYIPLFDPYSQEKIDAATSKMLKKIGLANFPKRISNNIQKRLF
jgi:hypothetical protein